jgi:hypothetical protein
MWRAYNYVIIKCERELKVMQDALTNLFLCKHYNLYQIYMHYDIFQ